MDKEIKYIVGIDEVGRGPIAGPVCVAAFCILADDSDNLMEKFKIETNLPLRDSKKLTKKHREKWFSFLQEQKKNKVCDFAVSFVSPENIDKHGIAKCIQKALDTSLFNLIKNYNLEPNNYKLILDGGLKAPVEYINQETFIKGDELHPVISLASIVAKVSRDNLMEKFSKEYPEYGFEKHAGYGTKAHYEAIKKHGQTPIHRKTFIH